MEDVINYDDPKSIIESRLELNRIKFFLSILYQKVSREQNDLHMSKESGEKAREEKLKAYQQKRDEIILKTKELNTSEIILQKMIEIAHPKRNFHFSRFTIFLNAVVLIPIGLYHLGFLFIGFLFLLIYQILVEWKKWYINTQPIERTPISVDDDIERERTTIQLMRTNLLKLNMQIKLIEADITQLETHLKTYSENQRKMNDTLHYLTLIEDALRMQIHLD